MAFVAALTRDGNVLSCIRGGLNLRSFFLSLSDHSLPGMITTLPFVIEPLRRMSYVANEVHKLLFAGNRTLEIASNTDHLRKIGHRRR